MTAGRFTLPPTIEAAMRSRVASMRSLREQQFGHMAESPAALDILIGDLIGFAEAVVELLDPPAAPDRPAITLRGSRVEIPTRDELGADPRIEGFMRVAAYVGASGRWGGVDAEALLRDVGRIIAAVPGVPNPLAEDTEAFYRREALQRLTHKQRGRLGMRGEDPSEVGK